jgi:hypothetical protein
MGFRYRRNSLEALRSDSLFIAGYHGFRRTVTISYFFLFAVIDTITVIGTEIALLLLDLDSSHVQNDKLHEFGE